MLILKIRELVNSKLFGQAILGLILVAAVIVGLETYPEVMARYGDLIHTIDWVIITLFALEAILKMAQHGRHWYRYFYDPWNVFDFSIVVVCLLPVGGHAAAITRLVRVLRALRLISTLPKLQLLVEALLRSVPSMVYVGVLLVILFYIYAVMGVFAFRENDPVHFGNLQLALLSLFRIVTLEDWTDIMYIQMYGSDVFAIDNPAAQPEQPSAQPMLAVVYFVSFVLFGTMIMLNLFIGVIITSMEEAQAEAEARKEHPTVDDEFVELARDVDNIKLRLQAIRRHVSEKQP
ncbi:ion transporter [Mucisphaera calidilacus]|uniref:Ion transport protein n=1 Tax=Mucisphaera calidilacus TaxID=2527982 RepID=A0A518BXK3_9BACT|nr:ion transporter [Mucisphaera calidilacus]QDU71710.1 Ion transport protein [Mucisphaera calidilacus]